MAKLLFENGIKDPNLPNALMKSPLNIAIQKGNVEIVKLFFENIKNIDIWNSNINPLKQAVVGKHIDITKCILEHCQCTIDDIDKMLKLSESDAITILLRLYKNRIEKL